MRAVSLRRLLATSEDDTKTCLDCKDIVSSSDPRFEKVPIGLDKGIAGSRHRRIGSAKATHPGIPNMNESLSNEGIQVTCLALHIASYQGFQSQ